jgi:predicted nucleotide-binding protein
MGVRLKPYEELLALADKLEAAAQPEELSRAKPLIEALTTVTSKFHKASSGSWWGYQSRVYYNDFEAPPSGARFSQEDGLHETYHNETVGDWREFTYDEVSSAIEQRAGNPDLAPILACAQEANTTFSDARSEILSLISVDISGEDRYLDLLRDELKVLKVMSANEIAYEWVPKGKLITSDLDLINQRQQVPPHVMKQAVVVSINNAFSLCKQVSQIARRAGSHLERKERVLARSLRVGTNVFIGHGRSGAWRELKDFVRDRLSLPYDEFNRVPVAGITNISRLSEMLDAAAVAFVIMTAEDELADGKVQARMNVIHEVGLFQGKLGFTKAIVLLEDGCEEFSNIQGLGQIRFPAGRISAVFEDVRAVLERESVIVG